MPFDPKSLVPATAPTTIAGKLRTGTASSKRTQTPGQGPRAYTPAVMKTPRGRFAPISMNDTTGVITDTGFRKPTLSQDGSMILSATSEMKERDENEIIELAKKSKLPKGPLTMKSRAWLYNNMRAVLLEEDARMAAEEEAASTGRGSIASTTVFIAKWPKCNGFVSRFSRKYKQRKNTHASYAWCFRHVQWAANAMDSNGEGNDREFSRGKR